MENVFKRCLAAAALAGLGALVHATSTDSTTFQVKINIVESCDIHSTAATDVDFGTKARSTSVSEATGALKVLCTAGTQYTIALDNGNNYDTSNSTRQMRDGANFVAYGLYRNSGTSSPWDSSHSQSGVGNGWTQTVTVYGSIPAGATNVPAGTYNDTVTATISY